MTEAPGLTTQHQATTRLTQLKRGQRGIVVEASLDASDAALLRAMGLCAAAKVRLCRAGEPCIVAVDCGCGGQCRIGLARPLAERIMVRVDN
ncbi:MAG: ferrous iron transport protein A [Phycisphaerales bacterium]|nr:ferrous iron transport protein A [Phycisphaerales bacterium]